MKSGSLLRFKTCRRRVTFHLQRYVPFVMNIIYKMKFEHSQYVLEGMVSS